MHIAIDINTELHISSLTDLPKLKLLMENLKMKINKSELARKFNVDRRTIGKYLSGYKPNMTRKKMSKIDAYYDIIKRLLTDESPQKFYYKRILWQYLKDNHGLTCSASGFRAYISRKPEFQSYFESTRKRKSQKEVIRFETPPAEQAQLDWKENIKFMTKDGEVLHVNVCVLILAHSRFRTYHLSISKSQEVLLSFLTESFEAIGGVPKTLIVDNMKSVMDEPRTRYQKGKVNEKFYQFSKDFNFEVKPCLAGRPETKAKVEAPMKFLDEIHAYQGQLNYEELHHFVQKLCNRINNSYHQGTGAIPILGLEKERNLLSALPSNRKRDFYRIKHTLVKVNPSNMVNYLSNQYSVPAMCEVLQVPRSTFYYDTDIAVQKQQEKAAEDRILKEEVLTIFNNNRQVFGTRKIKEHLLDDGYTVSKRRIGRLMKELGIKSKYAQPSYKPMITKPNEDVAPNLLEQNFNVDEPMSVLVSDLTYIRVGKQWNYVCFLIDLYNREIVGHSAGKHKDAALVQHAFATVKHPLETVKIFHSDRGSEFKNVGIDELLSQYKIERSLSNKGNPYDNAVSEATFKILKTELINDMHFNTLEELSLELFDYVNWYNNIRKHSTISYLSPVTYRNKALKKIV